MSGKILSSIELEVEDTVLGVLLCINFHTFEHVDCAVSW